jgi:hypothetical protein
MFEYNIVFALLLFSFFVFSSVVIYYQYKLSDQINIMHEDLVNFQIQFSVYCQRQGD